MEKISFIGAGSMAEAVIAGIVRKQVFAKENIYVTNKENKQRLQELEENYGIQSSSDRREVVSQADILVIATKPYDVELALQETTPYIREGQLIISVVAGVPTKKIEETVGQEIGVIRSMPNTSATIGYSATALCKGRYATEGEIVVARRLFEAIGEVVLVDEEQMHIVTGLSGSGPAYIYYMVEAMEQAAMEEGLEPSTAKQLITQTVIGAGKMLAERPESPAQLREQVTSPNGTTAAGIATLEAFDVKRAMVECVKQATRRSEALGSSE